MRTLLAVIAGTIVLAVSAPIAAAATSGAEAPLSEQPDLTGTPLKVGATVYGKFLASRHAESVGDFAAAASFAAEVLAENPELKDIARRGHLLMASVGRIEEAAELAEQVIAENERDPLANMTLAVRAIKGEEYRQALE